MTAPGRWGDQTVPKSGWECEGFRDLNPEDGTPFEEYHAVCEMCELKHIRYQHVMTHSQWPGPILAGVVCAGKMENNKAAAKRRERDAINRSKRRERWPNLRTWNVSERGSHHISRDGIHILIYRQKNRQWRIRVKCEHTGDYCRGKKQFTTLEEAKLKSFEAYEYASGKLGWGRGRRPNIYAAKGTL